MGRQIAHVMGWQGAAWLEREEREREERSDLLLGILALAPGMTVADVGAGTGYYSRCIAELVGPTGKVYAVDVQPEMCMRQARGRVIFVEYRAEDPRVPIKPLHKMSETQIRREAEVHPLVWERTANDLPWQHVVIFQRR